MLETIECRNLISNLMMKYSLFLKVKLHIKAVKWNLVATAAVMFSKIIKMQNIVSFVDFLTVLNVDKKQDSIHNSIIKILQHLLKLIEAAK